MRYFFPVIISVFALVLASLPARAAYDSKPYSVEQTAESKKFPARVFNAPPAEKAAMDINPDLYTDFWKKWHFVSVRWRQDVREIRLTYANDLAWKTLSEQRTDYPVGAMFGKLVYPAEEDLALPSSLLTSNLLSRFMVMLWDPKHPKKGSDGWTYVRFINTSPGDPIDKDSTGIPGVMSEKEIAACVECHKRAYDRGNVFSQPMYLFREKEHEAVVSDTKVLSNRFEDSMKEIPPTGIPRIAASLIDSIPHWKGRKVMGYVGDFFSGSLGEMGPVMTKMAQGKPDNIYMINDRDDPNTLELASSLQKKGHENCVGLVRVRGVQTTGIALGVGIKNLPVDKQKRVRDLFQQYKPAAALFVICGSERVSRQNLPLKYLEKDKDGLPSYYFAPAELD